MDIKLKVVDEIMYVKLIGELDEYTSSFTREYLDNAFFDYKFKNVVIDMSNLKFMDSTGVGVLLGRYKKLKNKNKQIYISNATGAIERIINMSGIYEIMPKI